MLLGFGVFIDICCMMSSYENWSEDHNIFNQEINGRVKINVLRKLERILLENWSCGGENLRSSCEEIRQPNCVLIQVVPRIYVVSLVCSLAKSLALLTNTYTSVYTCVLFHLASVSYYLLKHGILQLGLLRMRSLGILQRKSHLCIPAKRIAHNLSPNFHISIYIFPESV